MPQINVIFYHCVPNYQEHGSHDRYSITRVFFSIAVDGQLSGEFDADVKQIAGDGYESGKMEVSLPVGYRGPFNQYEFAKHLKVYVRSWVGQYGAEKRDASETNNTIGSRSHKVYKAEFAADFSGASPTSRFQPDPFW